MSQHRSTIMEARTNRRPTDAGDVVKPTTAILFITE